MEVDAPGCSGARSGLCSGGFYNLIGVNLRTKDFKGRRSHMRACDQSISRHPVSGSHRQSVNYRGHETRPYFAIEIGFDLSVLYASLKAGAYLFNTLRSKLLAELT